MTPGVETAAAIQVHLARSWAQDMLSNLKTLHANAEIRFDREQALTKLVAKLDGWLQKASNRRLDSYWRRLVHKFNLWRLRIRFRSELLAGARSAKSTEYAIALFEDTIKNSTTGRGIAILSGKDNHGKRHWYNMVVSDGETLVHDAQTSDSRGFLHPLDLKQLPELSDVKMSIDNVDSKLARMTWQDIVKKSRSS